MTAHSGTLRSTRSRRTPCCCSRRPWPRCSPGDWVLEVGTGSGHIAASLAGRAALVVALDINPHAVRAARRRDVEVIRADLFAGVRGPFDLVLFNPPYLPTAPDERLDDWLEYALDGGPDGRRTIARFLDGLPAVLAPAGGRYSWSRR